MSRFATLKKHNNDSLSSTQKPPNFRHLMGSRIGTASSHPMESRSVTPSAPYSTGAAQHQSGGESSCRKSEPFSIFLETTFAFFWAKAAQPAHFWASWQTRLVFHFGNTNTGTGGAVRFPKTESKIGCSFLSRQYQKQALSKNGKQVSLIFE